MHESLPRVSARSFTRNLTLNCVQGDLSELLGSFLDQASTTMQVQDASGLPALPADARHPYHLVVVYACSPLRQRSRLNIPRQRGARVSNRNR